LLGYYGRTDIMERTAWDGVFSTVTAETLPCAIWQLATEHMAIL
jgi:hypothetical protein